MEVRVADLPHLLERTGGANRLRLCPSGAAACPEISAHHTRSCGRVRAQHRSVQYKAPGRQQMKMRVTSILCIFMALVALSLPACNTHKGEGEEHKEQQKIVVTTPLMKDLTVTQRYVCQIRSRRNIEVRALQEGFLLPITVTEGQPVKKGEVLFQILPTLFKTRLDAEEAEANQAQIEYEQSQRLAAKTVVSQIDVALAKAKADKANAKVAQARAELAFTTVTAQFDGIIDRLLKQEGSLVKKEDVLTTLSDNEVMWVYFNVPEARYLEYQGREKSKKQSQKLKLENSRIELMLADGSKFKSDAGDTVTVEGTFNNETGNIAFRADFPNRDGLLRHGQTGNVLILRSLQNAIVIPQRATFEILDKTYVWVIGADNVVHQRLITILHEQEDVYILKNGLDLKDKIILEGVRQVRDGDKVAEYETLKPEEVLSNQKNPAE
jgi:membrane fusion protein (multidrug efflux system)